MKGSCNMHKMNFLEIRWINLSICDDMFDENDYKISNGNSTLPYYKGIFKGILNTDLIIFHIFYYTRHSLS